VPPEPEDVRVAGRYGGLAETVRVVPKLARTPGMSSFFGRPPCRETTDGLDAFSVTFVRERIASSRFSDRADVKNPALLDDVDIESQAPACFVASAEETSKVVSSAAGPLKYSLFPTWSARRFT
jgi:hypothetical protein